MKRVLFIIFPLIVFSSCSSDIERSLRTMMKAPVSLPDNIRMIGELDSLRNSSEVLDYPCLLLYMDSTQCSPCRLQHLSSYSILREKYDRKFSVCVIMAPKEKDRKISIHMASMQHEDIQVYLDEDYSFLKHNPQIPEDSRFHSMMLDKSGYPIIVGDPVINAGINRLYKNQFR